MHGHRSLPFFVTTVGISSLLLAGCVAVATPAALGTPLPIQFSATPTPPTAAAIATAEAEVTAAPQNAEAWYHLGNARINSASDAADPQARAALFDGAIAAYLRALELNPKDAAAMHNLGTVYLQMGKLADARSQFENALQLDASDPKTLYMLGTIYLQEDPYGSAQTNQRAREKFEAALKADPRLAVAYVGLAQVFLNEGKTAEALDSARKGVELSGDNVDPFTYWQLAQAQCAGGDAASGNATLQKILAAAVPNQAFNDQVRALMSVCK